MNVEKYNENNDKHRENVVPNKIACTPIFVQLQTNIRYTIKTICTTFHLAVFSWQQQKKKKEKGL